LDSVDTKFWPNPESKGYRLNGSTKGAMSGRSRLILQKHTHMVAWQRCYNRCRQAIGTVNKRTVAKWNKETCQLILSIEWNTWMCSVVDWLVADLWSVDYCQWHVSWRGGLHLIGRQEKDIKEGKTSKEGAITCASRWTQKFHEKDST
jgi:hypothetical protein